MSRRSIIATTSAALVVVIAAVVVGLLTSNSAAAHGGPTVYRWGHPAGSGATSGGAGGGGGGHHHHHHHHGTGVVGATNSTALTASPGGSGHPAIAPGVQGRVVQIAASNSDTYALTSSGAVYAWGAGAGGELGAGSAYLPRQSNRAVKVRFPAGVRITALPNPTPFDGGMAIDSQGHVYAWGNDSSHQFCQSSTTPIDTPVEVPLSHVTLATGALKHTIYDSDGHVVSCGIGKDGQLGNGTSGSGSDSATPVAVKGLPSGTVSALTSAWGNAGVLMADGSYYDWGYNAAGQVGDGTTSEQTTAKRVALPDGVSQVSEGGSIAQNGQTMAILRNGQLWEWGNDEFGQLGDGRTSNRPSPFRLTKPAGVRFVKVNSGGGTDYAISHTGELYGWGHNNLGQVGDGTKSGRVLTPHRDGITVTQVASTASEAAALDVSR